MIEPVATTRATGKVTTPALTGSHYRQSGVGESEVTLNFAGISCLNEFLAKVRRYVEASPGNEWLTGGR